MPGRAIAAGEDTPGLARLAAEDGIAVERDSDDIGVDLARPLGCERRQRRVEATMFGQCLRWRTITLDVDALIGKEGELLRRGALDEGDGELMLRRLVTRCLRRGREWQERGSCA